MADEVPADSGGVRDACPRGSALHRHTWEMG